MNIVLRYFQIVLPFLALFENALRLTGSDAAIKIADATETYVKAAQTGLDTLPAPTAPTVIKGTQAISTYGESVIAHINAIAASSLDKAAKISEATQLAATLSDSSIVFQPQHGKDYLALNDYKAKALNLVNEISR